MSAAMRFASTRLSMPRMRESSSGWEVREAEESGGEAGAATDCLGAVALNRTSATKGRLGYKPPMETVAMVFRSCRGDVALARVFASSTNFFGRNPSFRLDQGCEKSA